MPITITIPELAIVYNLDLMAWEKEQLKEDLYKLVCKYKYSPKQYANK